MTTRITEQQAFTITEAEGSSSSSPRLMIDLITPGWGSSGYYSPKVLENAASSRVFPKGTKMFLDHPGEAERHDRPERSVRDLAAVLEEDAEWTGTSLRGPAKIIGPYRDLLTDETVIENIGTSIVAYAETTVGEAEGRKGTIVTELTEGFSVDFVTFPGRGGAILSVLESARRGVSEATANDTREALAAATRAAYGGEETYVWVRDFDESQVWFSVEDDDSIKTFQQGYSLGEDGAAELSAGDPTEVRARTEYVPVTAAEAAPIPPVNPAGSVKSPEEDAMTQISEAAREAALTEAEGRVREAEQRATAAEAERDAERKARQRAERERDAATLMAENGHQFTKLERKGLMAELPATEEGALDSEAFKTSLTEAAAESSREVGITGFGTTESGTESGGDAVPSMDDYEAAFAGRKG